MAKIPLPERGQPLDVTYIYQLANTVNDLSSQISSATYNYAVIDTQNAGKQSMKTSDVKIVGGYIQVATGSTVNVGQEKSFSYSFQNGFKYPPIVTATAINIGGTNAGKNVLVILNNITTTSVDGIVRYNESGDLSIVVNVIAIGVPN